MGEVKQGTVQAAVVVNPVKVDDMDSFREIVTKEFDRNGHPEPTWWETTLEDAGGGLARQAIAAGANLVIACGGDGTVAACVDALAGTDVALAVVPAGTGNLLAKNLGLPLDRAPAIAVATGTGRRRLDVGMVEGKAFVVMAGMGFDARLLADTSDELKARIGALAYVASAARHLRGRRMRLRVRLDGGIPFTRKARTVLVANVGRLQGGITLVADARVDNGTLEVAILSPRTLGHWARLAWGVLTRHRRPTRMETFRCHEVVLEADRPEPRELDGDLIEPSDTMTVTVRPGALLMCVEP